MTFGVFMCVAWGAIMLAGGLASLVVSMCLFGDSVQEKRVGHTLFYVAAFHVTLTVMWCGLSIVQWAKGV